MGGFFKSPEAKVQKPVAVVQAAAPAPAVQASAVPTAQENEERRQRLEALTRQRRGRASTITTTPRGLLTLGTDAPQRKLLLGE
jgi:hypothetical protein